MQIRKSHRILAAVLTLVMLVGLLPTAAFAKSAGNDGSAEMNEAYGAHESLMPIGPSFNVDTLLSGRRSLTGCSLQPGQHSPWRTGLAASW